MSRPRFAAWRRYFNNRCQSRRKHLKLASRRACYFVGEFQAFAQHFRNYAPRGIVAWGDGGRTRGLFDSIQHWRLRMPNPAPFDWDM